MPTQCYSSIQGLAMRATRLDVCGARVTTGTTNIVRTDGFVSIGLTAQYEEGTEYTAKNASGKLCVSEKGKRQLTRYDLAISFCQVDPALFELMGGVEAVLNYAGDVVGFAIDRDPSPGDVALEVWTKVPASPDAECDVSGGGSGLYIYWLLPWVADGTPGDWTIEDGLANFSIAASTKYGNQWGQGPTGYNVVTVDATNTPGLIVAPGVLPSQHVYHRLTTIAPPAVGCGYQTAAA